MADIVERADAGDLGCRKYLIAYVDRGDRRRLAALRQAEKAKTDSLRTLERAAARAASLTPEVSAEKAAAEVKTISPTQPSRVPTIAVPRRAPPVDASMFRRDPRTGALLGADGLALSREEEDRLLYPEWPHVSPHLKKSEDAGFATDRNTAAQTARETGAITGVKTGPETGFKTGIKTGMPGPVTRPQAIDSAQNSESEKISHENPAAGTNGKDTLH
jgi:hypothetical protein